MLTEITKHYDCHTHVVQMEDGRYFGYVEVFLGDTQMQTGEFGKAGIFLSYEEAHDAVTELCKRISAHYNEE